MSMIVFIVWLQFIICAACIAVAGFYLSRYGDVIARRTGMSGSWIGLVLVATVTSLPELATGVTSVTIAHAPNLAVGDALGSCVVNLVFLVLIDFVFRQGPIWRRASQGHVLAAAFGVVLLGYALVSLLMSQITNPAGENLGFKVPRLHFGLTTPILLMLYLVAMRTVFSYEKAHYVPVVNEEGDILPPLRLAVQRFFFAAVLVAVAGSWLPFAATNLSEIMGWSRTFVGSLFVAFVTSLPELVITLSALRIGAVDMAIGNLLGSNLFNVVIIAIDDLFYQSGSLLADVSLVHAVTAGSAIIMTGLAMIGLFFRPDSRVLRAVGWVSIGLAAMYLLNTYILYIYGE